MSMKHDSHDTSANPTTDSPTCRGRDTRKGAQDDDTASNDKESPNEPPHGHVSHGKGRFLAWVGQRRDEIDGFDPELTDLPELYDQWRDDGEQADLGRWDDE